MPKQKHPKWVLDRPLRSVAETYKDPGNWHQVARVRTVCGLQIQDDWHRAQDFSAYVGPAQDMRCQKCEVKRPTIPCPE
jgi:hypothetical protein